MREGYDVQQVCINGHQISDSICAYPQHKKDFCDKCGAKTIFKCEKCRKDIQGHYHIDGVITTRSAKVPSHCNSCGYPFPWTEAQQQKAVNAAIKTEPSKEDQIELIKQICRKFPLFARQIQNRHDSRATIEFTDEYDVQDAFHAILKLHFADVRSEEYTPSYASSSSRIDFLLHDEEIAIEIKKTRKDLKDKEISNQLIIDKERYKSHPKCKTLVCFVYDPELKIGNPAAIEKDLTKKEGDLQVLTIIAPNGH